ncbi:MAG: polyprenyl diphosphate synthase, partial [Oscillospiraceae bacterium]
MDLPNHIGIIMDGNGRWAKSKGLPRKFGHKKGADVFKTVIRHLNKIGVKYVTVYAFSTENWKRPKEEIDGIIELLRNYLDNAKNYIKENIRTRFIGDISVFDSDIIQKIHECETESEKLTGLNLNIAINYGG